MSDVVVFAGTTEGCEVSSFLARHKVRVLACVATDYGSKSLKEDEYLKIHAGRLNESEMEAMLRKCSPKLVLDATHPYAAEVTENIRTACENTGFSYERVLREKGAHQEKAVYVEDTEAAVKFLEGTEGNILLTTGSKELGKFTNHQTRRNSIPQISLPASHACNNDAGSTRTCFGSRQTARPFQSKPHAESLWPCYPRLR